MSDGQNTNDWKERELGALWVKKSNNGSQYMTGHIELKDASGKVQLVVFKNRGKRNEDGTYSKSENAPDFRLYLSEKRENQTNKSAQPAQPAQASSSDDGALF